MRTYFNSKESREKQKQKNRLRNRMARRAKREKILKSLKTEIDRVSVGSKLAEVLSVKIST